MEKAKPDGTVMQSAELARLLGRARDQVLAQAYALAVRRPTEPEILAAGGKGLERQVRNARAAAERAEAAEAKRIALERWWPFALGRGLLTRLFVPELGPAKGARDRAENSLAAARRAARREATARLEAWTDERKRQLLAKASAIGAARDLVAAAEGSVEVPQGKVLTERWLGLLTDSLAAPDPGEDFDIAADRSELPPKFKSRFVTVVADAGSLRDPRPLVGLANLPSSGAAGFLLAARPPVRMPAELGGVRRRRVVPLLPGSRNTPERFYCPVPLSKDGGEDRPGVTVGTRGGRHLDLRSAPLGSLADLLPFVAQPQFVPLIPEHVPRTSWGASLANLLARSAWDRIRAEVAAPYGGRCSICAEQPRNAIECHEIWDYDLDRAEGGFRVQRLAGILPLCRACHRMFHLGLATKLGRGNAAAVRLADANGWPLAHLDILADWTDACHRERARYSWALDLSLVSRFGPLRLAGSVSKNRFGNLMHAGSDHPTRVIGLDTADRRL